MVPFVHRILKLLVIVTFLVSSFSTAPSVQASQAEQALAAGSPCIVRVKADAPAGGDGSTWAKAFDQLQPAINAASAGCEVWVAAGRYVPPINFAFKLKAGVKVYGGFTGTETNRYQRNWVTNVTTLSGDRNNDDAGGFDHMTDNTRVLEAISITNPETLLDGFTLSGGFSGIDTCGGAIFNSYSYASYANLIVDHNQAMYGGGICSNGNSGSKFNNIRITNNQAGNGAGMKIDIVGFTVLNNVYFYMNGAVDRFGISRITGGLQITGGGVNITNAWFQNNYAQYIGAIGIAGSTSNVNMNNVVMYSNFAEGYGGGLHLDSGIGSVFLTNCTLYNNYAGGWGAAINNNGSANAYYVRNSIIWGNLLNSGAASNLNGGLPSMSYSIIQGVANNDLYHIYGDRDPKFVSLYPSADLHLQADSQAINAGSNSSIVSDTTDLDHDGNTTEPLPYDYGGSPRVSDTAVDLGALEYGGAASAPVISEGDNTAYTASLVLHASDTNGDPLTWDIPSAPLNGTATLTPAADGLSAKVTYSTTPANNYAVAFPVRVSDGGLAGAGLIDLILVSYTPTPPSISDIPNQTTNRNIPVNEIPFTISDLISSPADLTLTVESSNPDLLPLDRISLGGAGSARTLSLAPVIGQSGTSTVTVHVTSGPLTSADTFLFTVTNQNTAPDAINDVAALHNGNLSVKVPVLTNDTDANQDPLSISAVTQGEHGSVTIADDQQSVTYVPAGDYPGLDTFTYTIQDGFGGSDTATVMVDTSPRVDVSLNTPHASIKVLAGTKAAVQISVQNAGPDSAAMILGMTLPEGVDLVPQGSTAGCTQTDRNIFCSPRSIPQGGLVLNFNLSVGYIREGTPLVCHAIIEADAFDINRKNNQLDVALEVYWLHSYIPMLTTGIGE